MDSFRDSQLLSARGGRLIVEGGHSTFHSVLDDIYHPEENPNGILSLGLAENVCCSRHHSVLGFLTLLHSH